MILNKISILSISKISTDDHVNVIRRVIDLSDLYIQEKLVQ